MEKRSSSTSLCKKGPDWYALITTLSEKMFYLWKGLHFPHPISSKNLICRIVANQICKAICLLQLELAIGRGEPREPILTMVWERAWVAFISKRMEVGRSKDNLAHLHPRKLAISITLRFFSPLFRGPEIRLLKGPLFSHLSSQIDKELSFPAIHLEPFEKTSSPFLRPTQVDEHEVRVVALLKLLRWDRYLFDNTLTHKEDFSEWNLQLSFARRAVFFGLAAWILRPPSSFAFVILFQPMWWTFFLFLDEP